MFSFQFQSFTNFHHSGHGGYVIRIGNTIKKASFDVCDHEWTFSISVWESETYFPLYGKERRDRVKALGKINEPGRCPCEHWRNNDHCFFQYSQDFKQCIDEGILLEFQLLK